jgi:hypothetical protein
MAENQHQGIYEYKKFQNRREEYYAGLEKIKELDYAFEDLLHHFPSFVGHMTLSRFLGLYELYKMTLGVAGHIGEIGVYKGASMLFFAKLVQIFESESLTQVHGFDWFEGTGSDVIESKVEVGTYKEDFERIVKLIQAQSLSDLAFIHKMDVTKDLKPFLERYPHLQFKIIFLDAGMYNVVSTVLPLLWDRLTTGGILILDQYNHELSPGETLAVREYLPNAKVRNLPNIWMPSGYIIKE